MDSQWLTGGGCSARILVSRSARTQWRNNARTSDHKYGKYELFSMRELCKLAVAMSCCCLLYERAIPMFSSESIDQFCRPMTIANQFVWNSVCLLARFLGKEGTPKVVIIDVPSTRFHANEPTNQPPPASEPLIPVLCTHSLKGLTHWQCLTIQ